MRIGGRGCPHCGSHDTHRMRRGSGEHICRTCKETWTPCGDACRGWELDYAAPDGPQILGCKRCGVPTPVARTWPETHYQLGVELRGRVEVLEATINRFPIRLDNRPLVVGRATKKLGSK